MGWADGRGVLMAQCTVICYFSSCMSTVPSITFYTFPPSSLPAHPPWSFCVCVCVASGGQLNIQEQGCQRGSW